MKEDLTTNQWVAWVLLGDPYVIVPKTLNQLAERIKTALVLSNKTKRAK